MHDDQYQSDGNDDNNDARSPIEEMPFRFPAEAELP
jgi:hypothetical protein